MLYAFEARADRHWKVGGSDFCIQRRLAQPDYRGCNRPAGHVYVLHNVVQWRKYEHILKQHANEDARLIRFDGNEWFKNANEDVTVADMDDLFRELLKDIGNLVEGSLLTRWTQLDLGYRGAVKRKREDDAFEKQRIATYRATCDVARKLGWLAHLTEAEQRDVTTDTEATAIARIGALVSQLTFEVEDDGMSAWLAANNRLVLQKWPDAETQGADEALLDEVQTLARAAGVRIVANGAQAFTLATIVQRVFEVCGIRLALTIKKSSTAPRKLLAVAARFENV